MKIASQLELLEKTYADRVAVYNQDFDEIDPRSPFSGGGNQGQRIAGCKDSQDFCPCKYTPSWPININMKFMEPVGSRSSDLRFSVS